MIGRRIHKYCSDDISQIENYESAKNDNSQIWDLHHRLELGSDYENTKSDLEMMNLYWNRPANELIFLTRDQHIRLHSLRKNGKKCPCYKHGRSIPKSMYRKALKQFKAGLITEDQLQPFRDEWTKSAKAKRKNRT